MHGLENRADGLSLALRTQDGRLLFALRGQDIALLLTLGGEDLGLLDALGVEDGGALLAFGAHLLLHRVDDGFRRVDGLDLHAGHPDSPLAGGIVEDAAEHVVDLVPGGEGGLQVHGADHASQHGSGELLDGLDVVDDLVVGRARVGDLEEQHRVDEDDQVVLGDHRRALEGDHLLTQVDERLDPVHERDDEVHSRLQRLAVASEALDVPGPRLGHDAHRADHHQDQQHGDDDADEEFREGHNHSRG